MWSIYDRLDEVKAANEALQSQISTDEKRIALKDLVGEAMNEGRVLLRMLRREESDEAKRVRLAEVDLWVHRTSGLIEAAFDKYEGQVLLESVGESTNTRHRSPANRISEMQARLKQLYELRSRVDTITIRPDFNPESWSALDTEDR
jgi:hypothetical protein